MSFRGTQSCGVWGPPFYLYLYLTVCAHMRGSTRQTKTILKYGQEWVGSADPLSIELAAIRELGKWEFRGRRCGEGLPFHVKQACRLLWPKRYWHAWSDLICEGFLSHSGRCGCWGPSSGQKSFHFVMFALVMFYARPKGTTVLISSTTLDDLQRRIWGYVLELDREGRETYPDIPGHFIESKLMLLADAKDIDGRSRKDGVIGVACRKSGQWEGLQAYVGTKNDVMILVCDECQFMPIGFLDSLANLESNDPCYAGLMGNLPDVENPLGWACEPKVGWEALPDTDVSRIIETKWVNGRAIQLVGMDSPNLKFPEGQEPYKGLIGRRYIEQCRVNYGSDSTKFHMFASGKVPQAGMHCTVFTKQECIKHNASASVMWGHEKVTRGYGLDAAYSGLGGDRTVGFPFVFGKDVQGKWRFWLGPMHVYAGSRDPKVTHAEAIAVECKRQCEAAGIGPENVFFDGTGRSELTSAFARLWSAEVVPIEFGGPATTRPTFTGEVWRPDEKKEKSAGTAKTCSEVFDRFVTELWFALKWCIVADQMRGMPQEAIDEGSLRKFEIVRGGREAVETKEEMKERGLRSPDMCFVAGTWVSTPFGESRIETLQVGDEVLTPLGVATIIAHRERYADDVVVTDFSNGTTLTGTCDHKIFTWNRGWVRLDALVLTDELDSIQGYQQWITRNQLFTKVTHTSFKALVDIIKTETGKVVWTDFYTDASGLRLTALSVKGFASTILTGIGQTTACVTWSCYQYLNTLHSMLWSGLKLILGGNSAFTPLELQPPQRGISPWKGVNGTHSMPSKYGWVKNLRAWASAKAVIVSSRRFAQMSPNTVQRYAGDKPLLNGCVLSRFVSFVANSLIPTNIRPRNTAPTIVAQSPLPGLNKVYTLSLDRDNVYYANGVLVANCDGIVCALEGARRLGFPLGKHVLPAKLNTMRGWWEAKRVESQKRNVKGLVAA